METILAHPEPWLQALLGLAVLLPLLSFVIILFAGRHLGGHGAGAGQLATLAIVGSLLFSSAAAAIWIGAHWPGETEGHRPGADELLAGPEEIVQVPLAVAGPAPGPEQAEQPGAARRESHEAADGHAAEPKPYYAGDWYVLGRFGSLTLSIGYYIDALTVAMFCMVSLIASCIHFYAMGYMHEELHEVTDHEVTLSDGSHLKRPGRFHQFFQSLSLFCFSMLGLVVAGNVLMTFVFWELVGICSYFLIGFYVERRSASTAANKAFIVNRIGDFGMIIGLMALWGSLGTLGYEEIFEAVRPASSSHHLVVPEGMARLAARDAMQEVQLQMAGAPPAAVVQAQDERLEELQLAHQGRLGYGLLIVAGLGIFCGCIGKSAQFPLHVWLPDAMEGPTPVSALVHSATMVAAGVFLVARFFPALAPEVLLVIAIVGTVTLFMAATIAMTATDIKRVLAYSTISQLGYMMLALGVGGWLAGVLHLFTHAFFKSLLFMCSGSVIHGVHTNEMPLMGGLRRKMPWTAYTMLVGCLAISGAGIPFIIGLSGYYSKDSILEQAFLFKEINPGWGPLFFFAAAGGAALTAFYMFRLWFLTFAGAPRDAHRYEHAHESPPVMFVPLVVLAVAAVGVAWRPHEALLGTLAAGLLMAGLRFFRGISAAEYRILLRLLTIMAAVFLLGGLLLLPAGGLHLANLLEQARPAGILASQTGVYTSMTWPNEHLSHAPAIAFPATVIAFSTALAGFVLAVAFYGLRRLDAEDVRQQFAGVYRFLVNKWWFDELYDILFVRPVLALASVVARFDRRWIDGLIDGTARLTRMFAAGWDRIADRAIVDGLVNQVAKWTYAAGVWLRVPQTGMLRHYVLFIALGTVTAFLILGAVWNLALAR